MSEITEPLRRITWNFQIFVPRAETVAIPEQLYCYSRAQRGSSLPARFRGVAKGSAQQTHQEGRARARS